ncbi:ThiF family adenylyltransferase [Bacillus solimangrovi]|uniref:THIF-type NAD/FAD binding fold domain-containing protein n=1 Tax=Bacillus solimangrovi TaxID=1305675 RepID=A0A1E5LJJ1_9BACI|nr:ThiF family adenylyltransferase [Bacillus solimangrovi]OEH94263.1 hypothetical protein BFG57_08370 [Bacillus solimangrovi]
MITVQFKPYVKVFLKDNLISFENPLYQKGIRSFELNNTGKLVCELISSKCAFEQLKNKLHQLNCYEEGMDIISNLEEFGYINLIETDREECTENYNSIQDTYNRIIPMWEMFNTDKTSMEIQHEIMKKRIGIVGCGTVGINIAIKLALFGISNYVLVDGDSIEASNLTRCPYLARKNIGEPKVDVLKRLIEERLDNSIVTPDIKTYQTFISEDNDLNQILDGIDILIVAADEENLLKGIQAYGDNYDVPVIYPGGYYGFDATIFPIYVKNKNQSPSEINAFLTKNKEDFGINLNQRDDIVVSSIVQTADKISNILSFEVLRYFVEGWTEHLERGALMYNLANNSLIDINK